MDWHEHISVDPPIRSGKPCIKGTRINVYDVLEYLAGGMSEEEILADFRERSFTEGFPSKVIWLDVGNGGTIKTIDAEDDLLVIAEASNGGEAVKVSKGLS